MNLTWITWNTSKILLLFYNLNTNSICEWYNNNAVTNKLIYVLSQLINLSIIIDRKNNKLYAYLNEGIRK